MTSLKMTFAAAVALFAVGTTVAFAQTTPATPPATMAPKPMTPPPAAPKSTAPAADSATKKMTAPRSEKSLACSAEATAKGLKGKPRKAFRKECMKKAA
jgi:psiF repeat